MTDPARSSSRAPGDRTALVLAVALVGAGVATAGCLSQETEDRPRPGPSQVSLDRAVEVATPHAREWSDDAAFAAAMTVEAPDGGVVPPPGTADAPLPAWLTAIARDRTDPRVADGQSPFWVLRFVSEANATARGYVVDAPNRTVSPLPDEVPLGQSEPLDEWTVNGTAAIEGARDGARLPEPGTNATALVVALVPASDGDATIPAWKVTPLAGTSMGTPTVVDANSGAVLSTRG